MMPDACRGIHVIGAMISSPPPPAREACYKTMHMNLGDPDSYPGLRDAMKRVISKTSIAALGRVYPGALTSGATETNILAALYWRSRGYQRIISFKHAHYSVWKAASILGMKKVAVESFDELSKILGPRDLLVLTVGTTETGGIDPIGEAVELARRVGAKVHIDAAFAGLIMRWLPNPISIELDDTIATLAVDLHKLGEAPIPLGVMLVGREPMLENLYYSSPYIPSGRQFGLLGSRPACTVFAANRSLEYLERLFGSKENMATTLLQETERLAHSLEEAGYVPAFPMKTPILCLKHVKIKMILQALDKRGVKAYRCPRYGGLRMVVMPHHIYEGLLERIERCLKDIALAGALGAEERSVGER